MRVVKIAHDYHYVRFIFVFFLLIIVTCFEIKIACFSFMFSERA